MIHHSANRTVSASDRVLRLGDFDDLLEGIGGIRVQRDHALSVTLPDRYTQPWVAVGVGVQAVDGQASDLVSACAGPPNGEQCRALIRILEFVDGRNHRL
jgi:hypothetical protein